MAARVTPEDREKTGFSDGSFPVNSRSQAMSAIKLRHNGKSHSAGEVLAKVAEWAKAHGDKGVLAAVLEARQRDRAG